MIHNDGTRAARPAVTHVLRARQPQPELERALERPMRLNEQLTAPSVEAECYDDGDNSRRVLRGVVRLQLGVADKDPAANRTAQLTEQRGHGLYQRGRLRLCGFLCVHGIPPFAFSDDFDLLNTILS
jgi:hypothetical protein